MGARPEDYERASPRKSFIHVDDFDGPQKLAEYLHKLDQDDDLYNEYFQWKVGCMSTISQTGCANDFFTPWLSLCKRPVRVLYVQ